MSETTVLLLSGVIGILSGLVASAMFLLFMSQFRPRMAISPVIAKYTDPEGNVKYSIKVINHTPKPIINIRAVMYIATPYNVPKGTIYTTKPVKLKTSEALDMARFDKKDKDANYAVRFVTFDNLEECWTQQELSKVIFKIYATHALTGFGRTCVMEYHEKRTCLKEGNFAHGNSLDVE